MYQKIRVGAVSYLNTKPLTYGFESGLMKDNLELITQPPAVLADKLRKDEIDVGLIPVAAIPLLKESHIISNYCIGADGPVASVALFSEVPLDRIEKIILDFESRTSVALLKLLLQSHWKWSPEVLPSVSGYEKDISGSVAALVIGDRALALSGKTAYKYDLSAAWKEMTGLPFVFAAWVTNKKLPDAFIDEFNAAVSYGFDFIPDIIRANPFPFYDLERYYTRDISYQLNEDKRSAMSLFLESISAQKII